MTTIAPLKTLAALGLGTALSFAMITAEAAQLRPNVAVFDDTVRLGDLFENAGEQATQPVANAPAIGQPMTLDRKFLQSLASLYHVEWQPASEDASVVVTRTAKSIGLEELRGPVIAALARRTVGGRLQVEFDNPQFRAVIAPGTPQVVTVDNLYYSPNQTRFSADIVIGLGSPTPQRVSLSGHVTLMVSMPVLVHRINPGDIITKADIGWVEFNAAQLFGDLAANEADLIDHTPRRGLGVNNPISLRDLQNPHMISRNQLVTMVLRTRSMLITTQGKATQDGSKGEVIRVVNTQSNRTVDAIVTGPNQVTVAAPGALIN